MKQSFVFSGSGGQGIMSAGIMLAHTAYREAEVAINNILGKKDRMRYNVIPSVIYTNPEVASVGETSETVKAKGLDAKTESYTLRYSGRYIAENEGGNGFIKLRIAGQNLNLEEITQRLSQQPSFIYRKGDCYTHTCTRCCSCKCSYSYEGLCKE